MRKHAAAIARIGLATAVVMAGGLSGPACSSVLGIDEFAVDGCPNVGALQCLDSVTPQQCGANGQWETQPACIDQTCYQGVCTGTCAPGKRCTENTPQECNELGEWTDSDECVDQTCIAGDCVGECAPDQAQCLGNRPQACAMNGHWEDIPSGECINQTCLDGTCTGECAPGKRCLEDTPQQCDPSGHWMTMSVCGAGTHCSGGNCVMGICSPGDLRCVGNEPQVCDTAGTWQVNGACVQQTCMGGACVGVCALGEATCEGNMPKTCDSAGQWRLHPACPSTCVAGSCPGPSCQGLPETCGIASSESCCLSPVVLGGDFHRSNDQSYPATVSDFRLDRFEITVGRFRKFVDAYPGNTPPPGAGEHPLIPGSGWQSAWDTQLPMDQIALKTLVSCDPGYHTWTDMPSTSTENRPITCMNWYVAFAFCAWDGGRLPTEAEWNYAAAGGTEQRVFPWSNPPDSMIIDSAYAVYNCDGDWNTGCAPTDIAHVGSRSNSGGDGKFGQADLAGSMFEWNFDNFQDPYANPCVDCANMQGNLNPVVRGGSWFSTSTSQLLSSFRGGASPAERDRFTGARCARSP